MSAVWFLINSWDWQLACMLLLWPLTSLLTFAAHLFKVFAVTFSRWLVRCKMRSRCWAGRTVFWWVFKPLQVLLLLQSLSLGFKWTKTLIKKLFLFRRHRKKKPKLKSIYLSPEMRFNFHFICVTGRKKKKKKDSCGSQEPQVNNLASTSAIFHHTTLDVKQMNKHMYQTPTLNMKT